MKISSSKENAAVAALRTGDERAQRTSASDRVSVSEVERVEKLAEVAKEVASSSRVSRLADIEAAVRSGNYRPDAQRIAEQLLRSAEVSARLQAMFR